MESTQAMSSSGQESVICLVLLPECSASRLLWGSRAGEMGRAEIAALSLSTFTCVGGGAALGQLLALCLALPDTMQPQCICFVFQWRTGK